MRICMAATYDIQNSRSWSGTPYSLYSALSSIDTNEMTTLNLSQYHTAWNTKMNMLRHTDLRSSLKNRGRVSKLGLSEMNALNSSILQKRCQAKDYDVLLELGGFFSGKGMPPYYVYSDASHDLSLDYYAQYGKLPFGYSEQSLDAVRRSAEYVRKIYQNAEGVFCMSQWMANSMVHTTGVAPEKVHTVYAGANWHDVEVQFPSVPKTLEGKREIHLLLVGVSFEGKGVDLAIEAVQKLNQTSDKKFILHVCGIQTPFEHDEYVINHGFKAKTELVKLLTQCDVFVLPSRFDCFGIAFVEAMQFGLPCVGRRICAMPEIIDEGVNGALISPQDDPNELAQCIYDICADEQRYTQYSAMAMKKAERFTWQNVATDIMNVLCKKT